MLQKNSLNKSSKSPQKKDSGLFPAKDRTLSPPSGNSSNSFTLFNKRNGNLNVQCPPGVTFNRINYDYADAGCNMPVSEQDNLKHFSFKNNIAVTFRQCCSNVEDKKHNSFICTL